MNPAKIRIFALLLPGALCAAKLEPMTNEQYKKAYEQHMAEKKREEERKAKEAKEQSEASAEFEVGRKKYEGGKKKDSTAEPKYGDASVVEPGGTMLMSYSVTDKPANANISASTFQIGFNPSLNWFVIDYFYLLISPTLSYANVTATSGTTSSSTSITGVGGALGMGGIFHLTEQVFPYLELSGNYSYYSGSVASGASYATGTGKTFSLSFGTGLKIGVLSNGLFKVGFQLTRNFALETGDLGSTNFFLLSGYSLWF